MSARSKARARAVAVLFEADARGVPLGEVLEERIQHPGAETPLPEYARTVLTGVAAHYVELNNMIETHASRQLSRMASVDRAIARLGVWEIMYATDVPTAVAVSEAASLAERLSTEESAGYVSGLLGGIATAVATRAVSEQDPSASAVE